MALQLGLYFSTSWFLLPPYAPFLWTLPVPLFSLFSLSSLLSRLPLLLQTRPEITLPLCKSKPRLRLQEKEDAIPFNADKRKLVFSGGKRRKSQVFQHSDLCPCGSSAVLLEMLATTCSAAFSQLAFLQLL